jgi:hypothetical protein
LQCRRAAFWVLLAAVSLASTQTTGSTREDYLPISLIQLIASPDRYEGKKVHVVGFVHLEFEGNAIYLHREDYKQGLTAKALWLSDPKCFTSTKHDKEFVSGYAIVTGIFTAEHHGHFDLFAGEIHDISQCERAGP